MHLNHKSNFLGYFRFFYSVVGNKLIISICLSIGVSVLDGVGLAMFMPLLQSVAGNAPSTDDSMGQLHHITDFITSLGFSLTLETVLISLAILFSLKGMLKFMELNFQANVVQYFMKKVRHELVTSLTQISYQGFTKLDAGNIQNSFIAEVNRMSQAIRNYLSYSQALFMLITYVLFAMLANYQFALLLAISGGLTNLLYSRFYKKMKNASYEISKKGDNFNSYMIQAVHYFKYLKATNYIRNYSKKLGIVIDNTESLNKRIAYYNAITMGLREPMVILIVVTVIYVQLNFLGGELGSIILSLILFYRALNFLILLQQTWQSFIQNSGSLRSVSTISANMKEMAETQGTKVFEHLQREIHLKNASFAFGRNRVLNHVDVCVPRNQTIALVGESGSGKTTIANIITGLLFPDSGSITVDDIPLAAYNLDSYRGKIGYISQEPVVFNDNIFNNVTFWAEPTPENYERFWQVIEMASLTDFVLKQQDKELTKLGDNGILVSGGQKQRISIAREMFKKAEILILDEATSALDSETELMIQENIEKLHGHYTMIVIAHRLSTIKNVDRIYLLEHGKVAVSGNFQNMVKLSDKFKRMVELQGL